MDKFSAEEVYSFDVERAVLDHNIEMLRSAVDGLTECYRKIRHVAVDIKFKQAIEYQSRNTDWLAKKYMVEENIDYFAGFYIGLLYAVQEYLRDSALEEQAGDKLGSAANDIPHFEEVLFTVENGNGIRHGKLAESIGVDRSTLTGIMDRIVQSGAVIFSRPGKFKYYYLTELGARYCQLHRKQHDLKQDKDDLLDALVSLVGQAPRPEKLVGQIMELLYKKKQQGTQLCQMEEQPDVEEIPNAIPRTATSRPVGPKVLMDPDHSKSIDFIENENNLNTEPKVTFSKELVSIVANYQNRRQGAQA